MDNPHDKLLLAIGIGKKPDQGSGAPPSVRDRLMGGGNSSSPSSSAMPSPSPSTSGQGGKVSMDEACFKSADKLCGGCQWWTRETGDCGKVDGSPFAAGDGCEKYYSPVGSDDMGGMTGGSSEAQEQAGM